MELVYTKNSLTTEDLDYVRTTAGGIGGITKQLTSLSWSLGYDVRTEIGRRLKVFWRYTVESDAKSRIKVEMNTFERSTVLPLANVPIAVSNPWCEYEREVPTFRAEELVATKLSALLRLTGNFSIQSLSRP